MYYIDTPNTLIDPTRRKSLWDHAKAVQGIPGVILELGVYKGGSSVLLKRADPTRTVLACDTFGEGIFNVTEAEQAANTARSKDCELLQGSFADVNGKSVIAWLQSENVVPVVGRFPESCKTLDVAIALGHFDGDTYESCIAYIDWCWPRLSKGGIILFDDWEWPACPGVKQAAYERFGPARISKTCQWQAGICKT